MTTSQRALLQGVSRLGYANPFLPERVEMERAVLGDEFIEGEPVWSYRAEHPEPRANVWRIVAKLEPVVEQLGARLRAGVAAREQDLGLYEDAALQLLYQRCYPKFYEAGFGGERSNAGRWRFYNEFLADWRRCFAIEGVSFRRTRSAAHVRVFPTDSAGIRHHVPRHYRELAAGGAIARGGVAIHLHARYAAVPAHALRADGRIRDFDYGTFGDGEGAGGAGNRGIAIRAVRRPAAGVRGRWRDGVPADQHFGALADAGGIGVVRA